MAPRRILIVDDHAAFLSSARALLAAEGCDIVACAVDGDEALAMIGRAAIDVVLLDLYLPGVDGVAVAEQIAALDAPPAVILCRSTGLPRGSTTRLWPRRHRRPRRPARRRNHRRPSFDARVRW